MNFTFMLILILSIITFITYKSSPNKKYILVVLVSILVLNEIYNFKENFTYRLNDVDMTIPEVNNNIRQALECKKDFYVDKRNQQINIIQRMRNYLFNNNLYNIFGQQELPLSKENINIDMTNSVFNELPDPTNECREVCHLIEDETECIEAKDLSNNNLCDFSNNTIPKM